MRSGVQERITKIVVGIYCVNSGSCHVGASDVYTDGKG